MPETSSRALQKQSPVFDTATIPSVTYLIAFLSGYLAFNFFVSATAWIAFIILICVLCFNKIRLLNLLNIILILSLFFFGYIFGYHSYKHIYNEYNGIYEESISANFKVLSEIEHKDKQIKFEAQFLNTAYENKKCIITVYGSDGYDIDINDVVRVKNLELKTKLPYRTPDQLLYVSNDVSRKIFLTASSFDAVIEKISDGKFSITDYFNGVKDELRAILNKYLKKNQFDFVSGILTGYRDYNNENFNNVLSTTGITHVVVVSGMHFSLLIFIFVYVLRLLMIREKIAALLAIIFSFIIAVFFGISPSVLRALIMTDILLLADIFTRDKSSHFHYLILTAVIMIIINPFSVYDIGFILSFGSLIGIITFQSKLNKKIKYIPYKIKTIITATVSANLITIPICAFYFNTLSLGFIFGNLIVTPFVSLLMIYSLVCVLMALISETLGIIAFSSLNFFLGLMFIPLNLISQIRYLNFRVISPTISFILSFYIGLMLIAAKSKHQKIRMLIGIALIVCFFINLFIPVTNMLTNRTQIYALGEKASAKTVILSGGKTIVCDLSEYDNNYDLETVLRKKARSRVDVYILGSVEALDGLYFIKDRIEISKIIYPASFNEIIFFTEKLSNIDAQLISSDKFFEENSGNLLLTINNDINYNIDSVLIHGKRDRLLISKRIDDKYDERIYHIFSSDKLRFFKYNNLKLPEFLINNIDNIVYHRSIK